MSAGEHRPDFHERDDSPESWAPAFDLDRFSSLQVEDLVITFGEAATRQFDSNFSRQPVSPRDRRLAALGDQLSGDIRAFPDHDPTKAYELYMTLAKSEHRWPRLVAGNAMGKLLDHLPVDSDERRHATEQWIAMLSGEEDAVVLETTQMAISQAVYVGQFDQATAQRIDSMLPGDLVNDVDDE